MVWILDDEKKQKISLKQFIRIIRIAEADIEFRLPHHQFFLSLTYYIPFDSCGSGYIVVEDFIWILRKLCNVRASSLSHFFLNVILYII